MQERNPIGLAIAVSHPIQYYAPVFKQMAQKVRLKVFFTRSQGSLGYDKRFQRKIQWDIPLLEGYDYEFVKAGQLIKRLREFDPNQLLVYGWAHYSHLKLMFFFNKKLTVNFRGDSTLLDEQPRWKQMLKKLFLTWIYKRVDYAFYVGTCNKRYFLAYGLKEEQLCFAPHSIDNDRFSNPAGSVIRSDLGLSKNVILILYAGKFDQNKNPGLLLQAFIELNLADVHLLFAGSGLMEKSLILKSADITNVHFIPFQNQSAMPALYQACDLFCLPTKSDSWGLSINEAMAAGKAILASDKAGAAHDLVTRDNGRIFESNNLPDLKEKLRELTASRSWLQNAGNCSLNIIQDWSIEIQVKNMTKWLCTNS